MEPLTVVRQTLVGSVVQLEPLSIEHLEAFIAVGLGHDLFRWFPWSITTSTEMEAYVRGLLAASEQGSVLPFATRSLATGSVVGGTCYAAIEPRHRRLEIGGTWLAPSWQRTAANTEAKYLQLRHCFEVLGCLRVEFKTDACNTRSRAALLRIGAIEEGTLRQHLLCPGDRRRDSVYFSILDGEWPAVKERLEAMLARR